MNFSDVDDYITATLFPPDDALDSALKASDAAGLPSIQVSAPQGKMLHILALMNGSRKILEIGTLGGYSTIWLARALPEGGRLVTLEYDPHHAAVARANIERAGLADKVEVRVGAALETLPSLAAEAPFDFFFIDADKPNNPEYFRRAVALSRPGSVIVVDNVVRDGALADAQHSDERVQASRRLHEVMAAEPRVTATTIQTVGSKGWDGFAMARVNR
ncbi:MAG TPA: O-methyltransferase [Thermoanaerobaculia bacterium]|nr:O-methyltransferase [Thermoanaerobaculia bacterium]